MVSAKCVSFAPLRSLEIISQIMVKVRICPYKYMFPVFPKHPPAVSLQCLSLNPPNPFLNPSVPSPGSPLDFVSLYFSLCLWVDCLLPVSLVSYHFGPKSGLSIFRSFLRDCRKESDGQSQNFPLQGDWKSQTQFKIFVLWGQPISLLFCFFKVMSWEWGMWSGSRHKRRIPQMAA